jgi:ADP-heptose:LPS heptosyltransferase
MHATESKPWKLATPPQRILVIRYQATGDMVITLPYLNAFRKKFPHMAMHLITTREVSTIPLSLRLFDKVIAVDGKRNAKLQCLFTLFRLPWLLLQRYDVVMDLQHNRISQVIRHVLRPEAWCAFDRFSARSAGERTRRAIESVGLGTVDMDCTFEQVIDEQRITDALYRRGWKGRPMIVLNPAGAFDTRHWPLPYYVSLASHLKHSYPDVQFVITGLTDKLARATDYLKAALQDDLVDVTGQLDAAEAFALLRRTKLMISEDSGLMHMAWVQGIPTLAIFGSSRSDWSAPGGTWSVCLNSSDLPCGNCLLEKCIHGDNRCLTRQKPDIVHNHAVTLLQP